MPRREVILPQERQTETHVACARLTPEENLPQSYFDRPLAWTLRARVEPRLHAGDAHLVYGRRHFDCDLEPRPRPHLGNREPAPSELRDSKHSRFIKRRRRHRDAVRHSGAVLERHATRVGHGSIIANKRRKSIGNGVGNPPWGSTVRFLHLRIVCTYSSSGTITLYIPLRPESLPAGAGPD